MREVGEAGLDLMAAGEDLGTDRGHAKLRSIKRSDVAVAADDGREGAEEAVVTGDLAALALRLEGVTGSESA